MPQESEILVDIIVPIYGALEYVRRCVNAVLGNTLVPYLLWLADDGSPKDSGIRDYFADISDDDRLRFVLSNENLGFGKIVNLAASYGSAPFICNLNSDTEPQEGWLSAMLANMEDAEVGMVGAKLIYPPLPSRQTCSTHIPGRIQHAGLFFGADKAIRPAFQNYPFHHPLVDRRIEVSAVTHACVLLRRTAFGKGYDERFVRGAFEDVDMCLDFRQRGYKIIYEPEAVVWHAQGASYDHEFSKQNFKLLMSKWKDLIEPDPDIFQLHGRKVLPKPRYWWKE